jgi:hypothetical protein
MDFVMIIVHFIFNKKLDLKEENPILSVRDV